MEIGVSGVASSRHGDIGVLAKKAEDLGFESIWLPEHPVIPVNHNTKYRGSADGSIPEFMNHQVNPFIGLTLAAAATTKLKLGTGVCLVTEHNPLDLASKSPPWTIIPMAGSSSASAPAGSGRKAR